MLAASEIIVALIGAAATIVAAVIAVLLARKKKGGDENLSTSAEARKRRHKYDLFVSSPLAGFASDQELQESRRCIEQIVAVAETQFDFVVYWAGRNIQSKKDFDAADL